MDRRGKRSGQMAGWLAGWALAFALIGPPVAMGSDPLAGAPAPARPEGIVEGIGITVQPEGSTARVGIEYLISLPDDGSSVARLGLAGLIPGRVVEGGRDLAVRPIGDGWGVELRGLGEHRVEVTTTVPVRRFAEGQGVDLAIPPAASTRVALIAEHPLADPRAGPDEPLVIAAQDARRADGHLRPRARLDLTWRPSDPPGPTAEPLLTARGEVVVQPGPDALTITATWTMTPLRGVVRTLVLPVEPGDEAPVVRLDDQVAAVAAERRPRASGHGDEWHLSLPQPWLAGSAEPPHRVRVETRRSYPPRSVDGSVLLSLDPHPPAATVAGLVLGVAPSETWQAAAGDQPGWVRADPRTVGSSARSDPTATRAGPWLAWASEGSPPALMLTLQPVRPRFQARMQSVVTLGSERAAVASTLSGAVASGRLFEVRIEVPPGLRWDSPVDGPAGLSVRLDDPPGSDRPSPAAGSTLVATFDPPLDAGQAFALGLRGSCSIPDRGLAAISLFRAVEPVAGGSQLALVTGVDRRATPIEVGGGTGLRRIEADRPPDDWVWPGGSPPPPDRAVAWFRSDRAEASLRLAIEPALPLVRHHSTLSVAVDRRGAEVVEEVAGDVASGTLQTLEIALPPDLADRWIVEAGEGIEREPLGDDPASGWRRYRLKLARPTDAFQFRGRYRLDFDSDRTAGTPGVATPLRLAIRPIAVLTGQSTGRVVQIGADPDVALTTDAPGWTPRRPPPRSGGDSVQDVREVWEDASARAGAPITLAATPGRLADLPATVASRLWLRTVQRVEGGVFLSARYRLETHERTVTVRLPLGSRWVRGTAGGIDLSAGAVEQVDSATFRATLPPGLALGPLPLRIDAQIDDAAALPDLWPAPELVNGVVQQTVWELIPAGARVGVGIPDGWTDENHWVRQGLVWRREPARSEASLDRWIANEPPTDRAGAPPLNRSAATSPSPLDPLADGGDPVAPVRYLFSHPGPPQPVRFVTLGRSTLLLVCSGPVLLVGLLILVRRPPARWVGASLLVLTLGSVVAFETNTALLVLEFAALGFALLGIAVVLHQIIERRSRGGSTRSVTIDPAAYGAAPEPTEFSSGRETVIRTRPTPPVEEPTTSYPALAPPTATPDPASEATVAIGGEPR